MKMQTMLSVSAIAVIMVGIMPSRADAEALLFYAYENEGPYVVVPGYVGGAIGAAAAVPPVLVVGGAVCLVAAPFEGAEAAVFWTKLFGGMACICVSQGASAAVGAPFYVTKKVFWDGPRALVGYEKKR